MGLICPDILGPRGLGALSDYRHPVEQRDQARLVEEIGRADGLVAAHVVEGGPDPAERHVGQSGPGQPVGGELDGDRVLLRPAPGRPTIRAPSEPGGPWS